MHKLTMKQLVTVCKCFLEKIAYNVNICPIDPNTSKTITIVNITTLDVGVVMQLTLVFPKEQ